MNGVTIGLYGLYLILVGLKGNAGQLAGKVQDDAPKFLPWIIAIVVLAFVNSSSEAGRKVTGPFIFLLVLTFVLKRFDTLKSQSSQLWNLAAQAPGSNANSAIGSGDKVAPSGTMNSAGNQVPLNANPAVSDLLHNLDNPWADTQFNYQL